MTESASAVANKEVYRTLHDEIIAKRFKSPSAIRRHAHHTQYQVYVELVPAGATVLDAGCGEGVLSVLLAKKGCRVTGVDMSEPNIEAAKKYAAEQGVSERTDFLVGDIEHLAFADKSFDYVISSHVLEHVPDFEQGARELNRTARTQVIASIPTCLNPAAMVLLGGDNYWTISRHTPYAWLVGGARVLWALVIGQEGVNEGYAGREELIHIRRFPWRGKRRLEAVGLRVEWYRASSFTFPYLPFLVPLSRLLERFAWWPVLRECGYGVTYICTPSAKS